jgi:hypothetical protein
MHESFTQTSTNIAYHVELYREVIHNVIIFKQHTRIDYFFVHIVHIE